MAKELYAGPSMVHGQTMRATIQHIKGHGHGPKIATGRNRSAGRKTSAATFRKKAEKAFL